MAGMLAAIELRKQGYKNLVLFEKADNVGGTWRENSYPGLTCDVPAHHYTYSFARNPNWSQTYASGPEIQKYFESIYESHNLGECIQFNSEVSKLAFDGEYWTLDFLEQEAVIAKVVIAATGVLHHPKIPTLTGQDAFQGRQFHSAKWDNNLPLETLRMGVVGNGSSGIQIVSALAKEAKEVFHFQRTAQWMMPLENPSFSNEQKLAFKDPELLAQAMDLEGYAAAVDRYSHALIDMNSEAAHEMAMYCQMNLDRVIDPELKKLLTPDHKPLCKRLIWSSDYYDAIQKPNAHLITDSISYINQTGIVTDAETIDLDVIVYATGFDTSMFMRPINILGLNGITLEDYWKEYPKAYYSIAMPNFPNLFMLNGPNGPVGNFSLIDIAEHQMHYIAQLTKLLFQGQVKYMHPKIDATNKYEIARETAAKKTVWYLGGCNSWYLNSAGIPASWPWTYGRFVEAMQKPALDDFEVVSN
ncbi:MAG: NAD(P)/FAD-dependent oxidoreductase [Proteobacteria bacterium]|nr:NAD(P)/FAD-dependent oxidoreductase [Pseudomonadota bacterium]